MLHCAGVLGRLFPFAFAWREAAAADCRSVEYASSSYDHGVDGESRRRVLKFWKMICCSCDCCCDDDLFLFLFLLCK